MRTLKSTEWKDIKGYEGLYLINKNGEIKSNCGNWPQHYIKKFIMKSGYISVCLYKDGKKNTHKLHRLVASTFIENTHNKEQVNHKDGNKLNNHVDNLEWCTQSENQIHAFKNGLNHGRFGVENGHHRSIIQFDRNMKKIKTWNCMSEAQRALKINIANICNCCKGKIKTIGGFIFRYAEEL